MVKAIQDLIPQKDQSDKLKKILPLTEITEFRNSAFGITIQLSG